MESCVEWLDLIEHLNCGSELKKTRMGNCQFAFN